MRILRELKVGDKIQSRGITVQIKEILHQDAYFPDYLPEDRHYIDIEFKDINGSYRHWKSNIDGGNVIYKDSKYEELRGKMKEFYDRGNGRYIIPFKDIDEVVSKGIIVLLKKGYVMTVVDDGNSKNYIIYSIEKDTEAWQELSYCRDMLYDWLHKEFGVHYFTKMSFEEYDSNERYREAIDYVLEKAAYATNNIKGWSIALTILDKDLEFVEVLNACM